MDSTIKQEKKLVISSRGTNYIFWIKFVKLLIIADAFPPMRTSASIHMYDLSRELIKQGHKVSVIVPVSSSKKSFSVESYDGIRLVSVLTPKAKDAAYISRAFVEFISPYIIYYRLRTSQIYDEDFDGIIWYSPSIFFGPLISRLKKKFKCHSYLILRDMFPDWALDLGLMNKGIGYYLLKFVEHYQYRVASQIGIQAPGNFKYFNVGAFKIFKSKVELLWTWITPNITALNCSIDLKRTHLAGRKIIVYAGNMGVAQDFDLIINLVELFRDREDIGFVFVGRGSEVGRLRYVVDQCALANIIFYDEIDSTEISALYSQCSVGLISLDPRHKSINIPGKFLSYMASGLPVLARLNPGNDLVELININRVGASYIGSNALELKEIADDLIEMIKSDEYISIRCKDLVNSLFSTKNAALQIVKALECEN